ncbi:15938_t:CDS:1, partial [Funneliformis mosseae]
DGNKPVSLGDKFDRKRFVKKSSNFAKMRLNYPPPHQTKSLSARLPDEAFDSETVTLLPTMQTNNKHENRTTLGISILICFIVMLTLIIIAMCLGFYIKRKNKTPAAAFKKGHRKDPSPISAILSGSIIDTRIQEIRSESQRTSTSSILIE